MSWEKMINEGAFIKVGFEVMTDEEKIERYARLPILKKNLFHRNLTKKQAKK